MRNFRPGLWRLAAAALLPLTALAVLMLSGCGGSGGSTTAGSFLFTPQGGSVIPQGLVTYSYPAGAVSQGVSVSAAVTTTNTSPDLSNNPPSKPLSNAVLVTLGQNITFSTSQPATINLTYTPSTSNSTLVPRIYVQEPNTTTWTALPLTTSATGTISGTVTNLTSGETFAVFAPTVPTQPSS